MDNQALISVIIPVYNVEEYLRECIDSVINQTYTNLEIILVDDGSTDSSGKICDEYAEKDSRVSVVHQKNGGQSSARNIGALKSNGQYLYFIDSDDYIDDKALEILVRFISCENADFVFFNALSFNQSNGFDIVQNYLREKNYETKNGCRIFSELQNNKEYHCSIPLMFFDNNFYKRAQLKLLNGVYFEDMLFAYQAFCAAERVSYCDEALYYRRYRTNSTMTSIRTKKYYESCKTVCFAVEEYSEQIGKIDFEFAQKYIARCAMNVFNTYEQLGRKDKELCRKDLIEFKRYIIKNNHYKNKALKMRCYGKGFWFIYKVFEKTVGRLLKGKNE